MNLSHVNNLFSLLKILNITSTFAAFSKLSSLRVFACNYTLRAISIVYQKRTAAGIKVKVGARNSDELRADDFHSFSSLSRESYKNHKFDDISATQNYIILVSAIRRDRGVHTTAVAIQTS